jgi:hypothetical protein
MKAKSFVLKAEAVLCAFILLAVMCPLRITNTQAYTTDSKYFNAGGGTCGYYNRSVSSYSKSASWISVSCSGYGNFNIRVSAHTTPYTFRSSRWGYVDFKNSKGTVLRRITINQDAPYITASRSSVSLGALDTKSVGFTFTYNCPFTVSSSNYEFGLYNGSGDKLGNGGSYSSYGQSRTVNVTVRAINGANYSGSKKYATISLKHRATGKVVKTISVTQNTFSGKYVCSNSDGGTITVGAPANGSRKLCDATGFNVPIATMEKKNLVRNKLKFSFDSSPKKGYASSGTVYGCIHEELSDDPDWYQAELGTFTISSDRTTMQFTFKNAANSSTTYTYKLS